MQGFGDYEYDDYEDYEDYGNFEGNDIDEESEEEEMSEREGRNRDLVKGKNETTSHPATTKKPKPKTSKKPTLKYAYRLLGSKEQKLRS